MKKVFLDANILYSSTSRSLFIWLHINRAVEIYWSQPAWDEVFRNYGKNNPESDAKFRSPMKKNAIDEFPECMVSVAAFDSVGLSDKDDEHILAAAIQVDADFLLTNDVVLLSEKLPAAITVKLMRPDDFLVGDAVVYAPEITRQAVEDHIKSLSATKPSKADYLESLNRCLLGRFAGWL